MIIREIVDSISGLLFKMENSNLKNGYFQLFSSMCLEYMRGYMDYVINIQLAFTTDVLDSV